MILVTGKLGRTWVGAPNMYPVGLHDTASGPKLSIIGPQVPNYHSATGIFVRYAGHHSVKGPFIFTI